ncbi:TMEM175 family protein [Lentilactobacillus kisonensis]|uniref:Integral membrane protein n=1 Tax=Lentilactobacillus kisonensis F0435 TaxID=797516 RepID=H1LC81_9LACO|nr:TMEM175 family protein [Lentilactobacillus kisonensis]EHO54205.1 hypothetical protein HMPREF9104_00194 [Lentilactobacillus kisonensis F0435]
MTKNRLEAFTDAIIPIIMTVLVLELGTPKTYTWSGLWDMHEQLIAYAISFFLLAIVWGNHHHMFQIVKQIDGLVIWANPSSFSTYRLFPLQPKLSIMIPKAYLVLNCTRCYLFS